jgi:phosphohistidine phosphatase
MTIPTACPDFQIFCQKAFHQKRKNSLKLRWVLFFIRITAESLSSIFFKKTSDKAGMQQLILLRHAKSDWSVGDGTDFSRPLAPRGERELPVIASALKPYLAGRISCLCSPAMRTRQTFDIDAPYWPDIKPVYEESLYHASVGILLYTIEKTEKTADTVFIIGHNPGLSQLLRALSPQSPSHMPTSAAAIFKKQEDEQPANMTLTAFLTYKTLISNQEIK